MPAFVTSAGDLTAKTEDKEQGDASGLVSVSYLLAAGITTQTPWSRSAKRSIEIRAIFRGTAYAVKSFEKADAGRGGIPGMKVDLI